MTPIDLNLDSTPIITWLAQARQTGHLDEPALRRSLLARMIWQVSYQSNTGLIENVAYLIGWQTWGANPRVTLAQDIYALRHALATIGYHLAYSRHAVHKGFYLRGRPMLDPQLERRMIGAMAEIDPAQMAITRKLSVADRVAQALSMMDAAEQAGVYRLRLRKPHLSEQDALRIIRQGKVA